MKSITDTLLKPAMVFSGKLINTGERFVEFSERTRANDVLAGFTELLMWRTGWAATIAGERLEWRANRVAMRRIDDNDTGAPRFLGHEDLENARASREMAREAHPRP